MRRSVPAALLVATMLLTWPAEAQVATDQTILDATIVLSPPQGEGLCFQIPPGRLTVTVQVVQESVSTPSPRPTFNLNGLIADPDVRVTMVITPVETTTTIQLVGAMYCWRLAVATGSLPANIGTMPNAERGAFVQQVALRMVLTPQ